MSYIYLLLFIVTISGCTGSCSVVGKRIYGNGKLATENRKPASFTGIEVQGPYNVIFEQGTNFSVRIDGDENLLEYILTRVRGNSLRISSREGYNLKSKSGIKIYVTAPQINNLQIAGSGSIKSVSKLTNTSKIKIEVGGSGDVVIDVDAPEVDAEIAGSGSVTVKGTTRNFVADIAGSGEVYGFNLLTENTTVEIAGSGDAEVFAAKTLDISIAGSGDVRYKGTPAVKQSISGSGNIKQVNKTPLDGLFGIGYARFFSLINRLCFYPLAMITKTGI